MTTADLSALADATAAAVGGAVSVMDPAGYVVAYSSLPGQPIDDVRRDGILGKQVPAEYMAHHTDEDFRRSSTVRIVAVAGVLPRLAVPVTSGDEYLGSIWCIVPTAALSPPEPAAMAALQRAAAEAIPLLSQRPQATDIEKPRARELLTDPAAVTPDGQLYTVLATRVQSDRPDAAASRLRGMLELTFGQQVDSGAVVLDGAVFVVMRSEIPFTGGEFEHVRRRAVSALGIPVTFAIGGPDERPMTARVHAQWALDACDDGSPTIVFDDVRVQATLRRAGAALSEVSLALPAVERMLACDASEGTEYAATVLALLAHESNVAAASASLYLHPNTFRYRLRRTKELFGLDLADADTRLLVWMSLRLRAGR
ncbi:PucR family transcriptional regulator [Rhodococcoides yunnanense]|uniref:Helix-turn-helix domain-containing protein n=1 Tax=Rhodococcoides yunnanense TaxID=278209 RepID=A0ABU4BA74_9NOCA|nr:helix-turn-helix domain-containing protein [Rhodococcus yunnanensis]MDV6261026.1 helix-turn-helix domain-containing protein [Rhodococcus yunnanensis]